MSYYRPNYHRRNVIALRVQSAMITGYGGKEVPPNNRFYMGGETDVRGYEFYTISPFVFIPYSTSTTVAFYNPQHLNSAGQPTLEQVPVNVLEFVPTRPGGDLQAFSNLEYRIPLVKSYVSMSLFHDLGLNGIMRGSQLQLDPSAIALLQEQYPNADFPCQTPLSPCVHIPKNLPIASGTDFRPHTSAGLELDIQIPIIQAPFRIYYAYNYLRLDQTITPPQGAFYVQPDERESLEQLGVYNTQVVPAIQTFLAQTRSSQTIPPNLIEPKTALRFAVSRTF
jgi:outer membrane protein insertion porin family